MDEMLSQEEINALLEGLDDTSSSSEGSEYKLDDTEKDAIGEISNISMGTAATTLFSLVNQKVVITTPTVSVSNWKDLSKDFVKPCVAIQIVYKEGLEGTNLLILHEDDVKIIADLMMGGEGISTSAPLSDLHLSAISEAMNQMIGSAATSMSSMFAKKIDINPPSSNIVDFNVEESEEFAEFLNKEFLKVSFKMQIGDLVDSEMMQLYPMEFAKDIYENFMACQEVAEVEEETKEATEEQIPKEKQIPEKKPVEPTPNKQMSNQRMQMPNQTSGYSNMFNQGSENQFRNIDVQQAQFQDFDINAVMQQKENIDLIMDVPLEVTVELGRTSKPIKEILEFAPGTIIELKKLAGEPIDVLVNGKNVAKGEVVVIDENFGIRITDIIKNNHQSLIN
ncbi:flagellar motor switch phosphatase FliY [Vallitalea sp.]|jgi:flagellar motor switch protein FliN/FliY|uniref:flagellar motor switch phosphatase FliY n=1 Tax=Vallitalea sp. TaxID=1882829 RepID=UPI0025E36CCD|nr:flagellar motor switch phosphatase FliY [Vallitalea sp.]MCT4688236.1 flagellar motor switch phosphatase FliY [Vallitalea sp.]